MKAKVFLGSLNKHRYLELFQRGLEYIQFGEIASGKRVFIKPNLTFPEYRPGVMTHPDAIEAAIQAIQDYTPHIRLGDSDSGGYNRFSMDEVYRATGIITIAEKHGVEVVNLSKGGRKEIHFSYSGKDFNLELPSILLDETDLLVSMPVPKVHCNTQISLTFKNQWGCIPENKDRLRMHPYFKHVILEVNKAVKTRVAIIDGQYGLNRNGPMRGDTETLNWILVTDSPGAGAQIACDLMQIPLNRVPHLRYARQMGWIPDRDEIQTNSDPNLYKGPKFYLKRALTDLPGNLAFQSPAIAYLAYFSPLADFLHKVLYLVRKPFYDYDRSPKQ